MTKSTRTVLLVLLGLTVLGGLGAAGLTSLMVYAVNGFGGTGEWSEDGLPERELPATFGVRLPVKPLRYQSRSMGFQDAYYEVLVQLPPDGAESFLISNHLERGAKEAIDPDVLEQVRALEPNAPTLESTLLALPAALKADGGTWNLNRSGELLEGNGAVWIHLTAFET